MAVLSRKTREGGSREDMGYSVSGMVPVTVDECARAPRHTSPTMFWRSRFTHDLSRLAPCTGRRHFFPLLPPFYRQMSRLGRRTRVSSRPPRVRVSRFSVFGSYRPTSSIYIPPGTFPGTMKPLRSTTDSPGCHDDVGRKPFTGGPSNPAT